MAITFDAATNGSFALSTSYTFSHTTGSGSNRALFVSVVTNSASDLISGVTYAGVSMTRVTSISVSNRYLYIYRLVAPTTGANNVVISASSSTYIGGSAVSYAGVSQSSPIDTSATVSSSSNPVTHNITVSNDVWVLSSTANDSATSPGSSTNTPTLRTTNSTFTDMRIFDTNAALTPAGSKTVAVTNVSPNCALISVAINTASAVVNTNFLINN